MKIDRERLNQRMTLGFNFTPSKDMDGAESRESDKQIKEISMHENSSPASLNGDQNARSLNQLNRKESSLGFFESKPASKKRPNPFSQDQYNEIPDNENVQIVQEESSLSVLIDLTNPKVNDASKAIISTPGRIPLNNGMIEISMN